MGLSFANMHIQKNNITNADKIAKTLNKIFEKKGYHTVTDEKEADGAIYIYTPKDSEWITVCSDLIDFNASEDSEEFAAPLSEEFQTDVLSAACFDSDYLFLHLRNTLEKLDGWLNIRINTELPCLRRTGYAAWKKRIPDVEKLKEAIKEEYTFAEDALEPIGSLLGLSYEQGCLSEGEMNEAKDTAQVKRIFLCMEGDSQKELPNIYLHLPSLLPCKTGKEECLFAVNRGGKSRGIAIAFTIPGAEPDELILKNVDFEYNLDRQPRTVIPIEPELKQNEKTGNWSYYWSDENFLLPPKVNQSLPYTKIMNLEFKKIFGVRFTPYGNQRKFLDITVYFIPLGNTTKGGCKWCVWQWEKSKQEYINENNEHVRSGVYSKELYIDPNDYDL